LAAPDCNKESRSEAPGTIPNIASIPSSYNVSMPSPIYPAIAITGLPDARAARATPYGVLPNLVWKSIPPSPVNTISALYCFFSNQLFQHRFLCPL